MLNVNLPSLIDVIKWVYGPFQDDILYISMQSRKTSIDLVKQRNFENVISKR